MAEEKIYSKVLMNCLLILQSTCSRIVTVESGNVCLASATLK